MSLRFHCAPTSGMEKPNPGCEAITTSNASSSWPPWASGSVSGPMSPSNSRNEPGQPCMSSSGVASGTVERTWTAWMFCPSMFVMICGSTLRVDRMRNPVPLREQFPLRDIPDEALRQFTTRSITTAPYPYRATLRLHAPADVVSQRFPATIAEVIDGGDGTSILTAGAATPEEFVLYIGMSGIEFEVLEGDAVREALVEMAGRFARAAERPS